MSDPLNDKNPILGSKPTDDEKTGNKGGPKPPGKLTVSQFRNKSWILAIILAIVTIASMVFAWWNLESWLSLIIVAIFGTGVVLFLVWKVPKWQVSPYRDSLATKDQVELEIQARATLIQVVGGVALLASIFITAQNLMLTSRTVKTTEQNLKYARSIQIAERYAKAIEQLKNKDDIGVRLGGIYMLGILAKQEEAKEFSEPILRVLAEHIKDAAPLPESYNPDKVTLQPIARDIQAILNIIGDLKEKNPTLKLDLRGTNLSGAHFEEGYFQSIDFSDCYLGGAHFERANLESADFSGADLTEASFQGAILKNAQFVGAHLISTLFRNAYLESSNLSSAVVEGATFDNANMNQVDFKEANGSGWFKDVNLTAAKNFSCESIKILPPATTEKDEMVTPCPSPTPEPAVSPTPHPSPAVASDQQT